MNAFPKINATFAQQVMIYVLIYGRENLGRGNSDPLFDRTYRSDPAPSLLPPRVLREQESRKFGGM
jgi:hypothetical protein